MLDGVVQSAPAVSEPNFPQTISISGQGAGAFSESEARSLARVLDRGAFPVQVRTESVQTVSPTLGEDSLRAAIFAGLVGVVLVLLGLMYFYRRLIVVVIAGLAVWALLIYSAAAIISQTTNYALSLAGVTGIIVAVGITVDSYVVYFERLKEEVRHGRTVRNSAVRSFKATWRTIVAADLVSLIAAAVLFAPQRRLGARVRPVPRRHDGVRPDRLLVLHPPGGVAPRRHWLARRGRHVRPRGLRSDFQRGPSHDVR